MTNNTAAAIAKDLVEGGINARGTTKVTAEAHGVSVAAVRAVRSVVLKHGADAMSLCSMVDAITNGWEEKALSSL